MIPTPPESEAAHIRVLSQDMWESAVFVIPIKDRIINVGI